MIRGGRDRKRKPFSGRGSGGIMPAADRNPEPVDVELPPDRIADRLRAEQYRHFLGETWLQERLADGMAAAPAERAAVASVA